MILSSLNTGLLDEIAKLSHCSLTLTRNFYLEVVIAKDNADKDSRLDVNDSNRK